MLSIKYCWNGSICIINIRKVKNSKLRFWLGGISHRTINFHMQPTTATSNLGHGTLPWTVLKPHGTLYWTLLLSQRPSNLHNSLKVIKYKYSIYHTCEMPHVWPIKERKKNLTTRPSFSNQSLILAIYYFGIISKKNGRPKNYLLK